MLVDFDVGVGLSPKHHWDRVFEAAQIAVRLVRPPILVRSVRPKRPFQPMSRRRVTSAPGDHIDCPSRLRVSVLEYRRNLTGQSAFNSRPACSK